MRFPNCLRRLVEPHVLPILVSTYSELMRCENVAGRNRGGVDEEIERECQARNMSLKRHFDYFDITIYIHYESYYIEYIDQTCILGSPCTTGLPPSMQETFRYTI